LVNGPYISAESKRVTPSSTAFDDVPKIVEI